MKHSESIEYINQLINEIQRISDQIKKKGKASRLDIDLILAKVPELYDTLLAFPLTETDTVESPAEQAVVEEKSVPDPEPVEEKEIAFEPEKDIVEETPKAEVKDEETKDEEVEEPKEEKETEAEPEPEKSPEPEVAETAPAEEAKEEQVKSETPEKTITGEQKQEETPEKPREAAQPSLFDSVGNSHKSDETQKAVFEKFTKTEPSINEKIASGKQVPLAEKVKKTPISDIRSAINLNLKLSFIKELFKNDQKEYKRVIDFVQKCGNYSEAKLFITGEMDKNPHWKDHQDLVDTLMELIERRFR